MYKGPSHLSYCYQKIAWIHGHEHVSGLCMLLIPTILGSVRKSDDIYFDMIFHFVFVLKAA
jgi:hypothetical protein